MIINIRGTNGSGKSTIVRSLLGDRPSVIVDFVPYPAPTKKDPDRVLYIQGSVNPDSGVCAIGRYDKNACGGADGYSFKGAQTSIQASIEMAANAYPHVVFEGSLISTIYGPYVALARRLAQVQTTSWIALQVPYETCVERVLARSGKTSVREGVKQKSDIVAALATKVPRMGDDDVIRLYPVDRTEEGERIAKELCNVR